MYVIQHSDSTVSEDAVIEPRTVATLALTARRSNHLAKHVLLLGPGPGHPVGGEVLPRGARLPLLRARHDPLQAPPRLHLHQGRAGCGEIFILLKNCNIMLLKVLSSGN